jgi:hypothetical protein
MDRYKVTLKHGKSGKPLTTTSVEYVQAGDKRDAERIARDRLEGRLRGEEVKVISAEKQG